MRPPADTKHINVAHFVIENFLKAVNRRDGTVVGLSLEDFRFLYKYISQLLYGFRLDVKDETIFLGNRLDEVILIILE